MHNASMLLSEAVTELFDNNWSAKPASSLFLVKDEVDRIVSDFSPLEFSSSPFRS